MNREESKDKSKQQWRAGGVLKNMDTFGEPLPVFNVNGKYTIQTRCGGLMTLLIIIVVLLYAVVKFEHLVSRYNPLMSSYQQDVEKSEKLNLNEKGFRIAIPIEDYYTPKRLKNDPAFIKWVIRMWGKKDGKPYDRILTPHICNDEDYDQFYPIQEESAGLLKEIRSDPERGFYCLDWDEKDPIEIYGHENQDNH